MGTAALQAALPVSGSGSEGWSSVPQEGRPWRKGAHCGSRIRAAGPAAMARDARAALMDDQAAASRYGVASSFGSYCSALGGRIRVVAFRASHPAKPPSRQRRFVQRFLKWRAAESHYFGSAHSRSHHIRLPTRLRNPDPLNASSFRDIWPVLGFRELQAGNSLRKFFVLNWQMLSMM